MHAVQCSGIVGNCDRCGQLDFIANAVVGQKDIKLCINCSLVFMAELQKIIALGAQTETHWKPRLHDLYRMTPFESG